MLIRRKFVKSRLYVPVYEATFRMEAKDRRGRIVFEDEVHNLVVNSGKDLVLNTLFNGLGGATGLTAIGVGTDSTAATTAQTKLNPSVAGSVALQVFDSTPAASTAQSVTATTTFGTAAAVFNIQELGLFAGTTNGTSKMFDRAVVGPFNKSNTVTFAVTATITQS